MTQTGFVYLVGAGPGDPGLITLKGRETLRKADFILYDGLVNPLLLRHTSASAERSCRHQGAKGKWLDQEEINQQLIREAQKGKVVVRLKGGDPYIFGRGSEEAAALVEAGIPFEVVPGITAATAAAVYAGISLTHRDHASAVAYVTGHEDPTKPESSLDYQSLASFSGTLVFYMGLHRLPEIAASLIAAGKSPTTPACVVRRATWTDQQSVAAPLEELPEAVKQAQLKAPSLIIVGECVSQRDTIDWFEQKPLLGKRIGITRPEQQAEEAMLQCWEQGAEPVLLPTLEITQPDKWEAVDEVVEQFVNNDDRYHWLVFTSANGVDYFFNRLWETGHDSRVIGRMKIAVIGPATAKSLEKYHLRADLIPEEYRAESLAAALKEQVSDQNVLWIRANRGRDVLPEELKPVCRSFEEVIVYQHHDIDSWSDEIVHQLNKGPLDWIALSSPAIARNFQRLSESLPVDCRALAETRIATISPVTSEAAREVGMKVNAEAREFTWKGLLEAIQTAEQN